MMGDIRVRSSSPGSRTRLSSSSLHRDSPEVDFVQDMNNHRRRNRSASCFDQHSLSFRRSSLLDTASNKRLPVSAQGRQVPTSRRRNTTFGLDAVCTSAKPRVMDPLDSDDDDAADSAGDVFLHADRASSTADSDLTSVDGLNRVDRSWSVFSDHVRAVTVNGPSEFRRRRLARTCSQQFQQVVDDMTAERASADQQPPLPQPTAAADRRSTSRRWRTAYRRASSVNTLASRNSRARTSTSTDVVKEESVTPSTEPRSRGWRILRRLLVKEQQARKMIPNYQPWSILRRERVTARSSTNGADSWETRWRLYERYVDGVDSWEDGLSATGTDRLHNLQETKRTTQRLQRLAVTSTVTTRLRAASARPATLRHNEVMSSVSAAARRPIKSANAAVRGGQSPSLRQAFVAVY